MYEIIKSYMEEHLEENFGDDDLPSLPKMVADANAFFRDMEGCPPLDEFKEIADEVASEFMEILSEDDDDDDDDDE